MSEEVEQIETVEPEDVSVVDEILGGEIHSPKDEPPAQTESEPQAEQEPVKVENVAPEPAKVDDSARLTQEVEILNKRLRDTQSAMHKATTDKAALQKELDELRAKKTSDGDWFDEQDEEKFKKLEADIKKSDEDFETLNAQSNSIEQETALAHWDSLAVKVMAEHNDFEELVYKKLAPLLDEATGDKRVISLWNKESNKTPENAYKFAKNLQDYLDFNEDPTAYKARVASEAEQKFKNNNPESTAVIGKDGLDMVNSADSYVAPNKGGYSDSAVDDIFK